MAVSDGKEVTEGTVLQYVWLIPDQRLTLGSKVTVSAHSILDHDEDKFMDTTSWSFTTRGADTVGAMTDPGTYTQMVKHGNALYAIEDVGAGYYFAQDGSFVTDSGLRMHAIRMIDTSNMAKPVKGNLFGSLGAWDKDSPVAPSNLDARYKQLGLYHGPFAKSSITGLRVVEAVPIGGEKRDVLVVSTRPWTDKELLCAGDPGLGIEDIVRYRQNAIWVFDITGDDASLETSAGMKIPKTLMAASQGTESQNWVKAIGGAAGMLGSIKLRTGMTIWDADLWKASWDQDSATLSDWTIRYRTVGRNEGYFTDPASIVASNGFYGAAEVKESVTSAVFGEDGQGKPIAFATMGYSKGLLVAIQPKLCTAAPCGEALATFIGGGPLGMDKRISDLSEAVGHRYASIVETIKGTWQGTRGTQQGTLVLAGTSDNTFWVVQPDFGTDPLLATALAKATLDGKITRIIPDPKRMLVGVQVDNQAYVFDLKTLTGTADNPMILTPVYQFTTGGAWTIQNGILFLITPESEIKRLEIRNLDGISIRPQVGIPLLVDANQFFAGAFYEYNRSVLGDPNPPVSGTLPEKLIYAMTDTQGQNDGYPYLRHYYPDLGEMRISGVVNIQDPKQFLEATKKDSSWFMEAEAKLYDGESEIANAIDIQGLIISDDQKTASSNGKNSSRVYGDGDYARAVLALRDSEGTDFSSLMDKKFAYSPFAFFIKPEVLTRLDQEMRTDFKERFRVKVEFKLYKDEGQRAQGASEANLKPFEFAVKFNSNTRLFDVLRGGVWYFDPVVASPSPDDTAQNPFTADWLKRLVDAKGQPVDVSDYYKTRLSLTPGTIIHKGTNYNGVVFSDDMMSLHEDALAWIGLDVVQKLLDDTLPKLRRQVFEGQRNTRMTPLAQRFRNLFNDTPMDEKGKVDIKRAGDTAGAYGYRMANAVNALQFFSADEAGTARDLNLPTSWTKDPTRQSDDKDPEGRNLSSRIRPLVNQHLKNGKNYNPGNVLVNYLVAYPRLQKQGTNDNGLFPINTVLTRDLVIGPMGLSSTGFEPQRQAIDDRIAEFNTFPSLWNFDDSTKQSVWNASLKLTQALLTQQVVTDKNAIRTGNGDFYNKGVGLLQAAFQERWHPVPEPEDPAYIPGSWMNTHLYPWADDLKNSNYDTEPDFNKDVRNGIMNHLLGHTGANRVDVYVNGVQNVPEELEAAANALQQKLDRLEGRDQDSDPSRHIPVIAVYNSSAKKYFGGNDNNDLFDAGDMMRQKRETAQPLIKTSNIDSIKLIGALKGLVQDLWSRDFEIAFFKGRLKPDHLPTCVWTWGDDGPHELVDLVADVFAKDAIYSNGTWRDFVELTPLAPKTKNRIEDEFPVDETNKTPVQILSERKKLFDQAAKAFQPIAIAKHKEIHRSLTAIEPTLHAHSQGAVVSAVVHSRLGTVPISRSYSAELCIASGMPGGVITGHEPMDVAKVIRFVSYGGAANMYDWGPKPYFKSYAHHVNERDAVVFLFGMYDPFQTKLRKLLVCGDLLALTNPAMLPLISWSSKYSAATDAIVNDPLNPHFMKILSGPSQALTNEWNTGDHIVVFHDSQNNWNADEHNFVRGFCCSVGTEKNAAQYPKRGSNVQPTGTTNPMFWLWWTYGQNPNVVTGDMGCLYQQPK